MQNLMNDTRIAWLVPSVELGAYWQPVLREFTRVYQNTIFYTGQVWPGFDPNLPGCSAIEIVGETTFLETQKVEAGYGRGFLVVSPAIVGRLLKFKPQVVFPQAFSLWTVFSVLLKPICGWKLVIIYDGSSPNTDFRDSSFRTVARKWLAKFADGFVANSKAGKQYLMECLAVPESKIWLRVYLVPDALALQRRLQTTEVIDLNLKRPTFLYVGRITQRKGIKTLLEACAILKERGCENFHLLIVGKGDRWEELETLIREKGFEAQVTWAGWVEYGQLGPYFQQADVFVFPTYEDVWGMVVPEAMVFGKPILCSQGAAAAELIEEGKNGYIFDPHNPKELADKMGHLIEDPSLIEPMGARSREIIAQTTPETAAQSFVEVTEAILAQK
jgi:glycosyltransferase involved in cell wall biosynthesis